MRHQGPSERPRSPSAPTQELEEAYQDAASNVLLAICRHSWQGVARHLETELLKGVFPHRSLLYVMGILSSNGMSCAWGPGWAPSVPEPAGGMRQVMGRGQRVLSGAADQRDTCRTVHRLHN